MNKVKAMWKWLNENKIFLALVAVFSVLLSIFLRGRGTSDKVLDHISKVEKEVKERKTEEQSKKIDELNEMSKDAPISPNIEAPTDMETLRKEYEKL